jgi:hypothetical protein
MNDADLQEFVIQAALKHFREQAEAAIKDYNDLALKLGRPGFYQSTFCPDKPENG